VKAKSFDWAKASTRRRVKAQIFDWAFSWTLRNRWVWEKNAQNVAKSILGKNYWKMCTMLKSDPKLGLLLLFSNKLL
jgi:hypothetical protein